MVASLKSLDSTPVKVTGVLMGAGALTGILTVQSGRTA
jgi:hypothetical protein